MDSPHKYLPAGYPVRRRGSCVPAAYLICRALLEQGQRCFCVSGYVGKFGGSGLAVPDDRHTWVDLPDGTIIDPTIRQFRWWRAGMSVDRFVFAKELPGSFIARFEATYRQPWTDAGAHYRKFSDWITIGEPYGRRNQRIIQIRIGSPLQLPVPEVP